MVVQLVQSNEKNVIKSSILCMPLFPLNVDGMERGHISQTQTLWNRHLNTLGLVSFPMASACYRDNMAHELVLIEPGIE